jgi:hypothetical protein
MYLVLLKIVHIESVGIYTSQILFVKAIKIIKEKCEKWKEILKEENNN